MKRFQYGCVTVFVGGVNMTRLEELLDDCETQEERILAVYEAVARAALRVVAEGAVVLTPDYKWSISRWVFQGNSPRVVLAPELNGAGTLVYSPKERA